MPKQTNIEGYLTLAELQTKELEALLERLANEKGIKYPHITVEAICDECEEPISDCVCWMNVQRATYTYVDPTEAGDDTAYDIEV